MVYTSANILTHPSVQLTQGGLILIGLLSGGDYDPTGLPHCGPGIAHGLARCGFGDDLLKAAQSLTCNELPNFLTTWREDLRDELRTNAHGHLGSKKPSLAKAVPDSFPDINVLLLYTNPITSMTDAAAHHTHTPPLWKHEPDLGKLAHLCELHFEWGLKDIIIKRFRTIMWPSIVLCALRRSALELDVAVPGSCGMPGGARNTGSGDGGLQELIVKIHGSRMHAYTDSILEYRLEVAPAQLVHLTCAGIQGLRKPVDTTYDVQPSSESEEESGRDSDGGKTGRRKRKHGAGPPPEPDSHLRMWMPASMVRLALPDLVEQYEAGLEKKHMKKSKAKQQAPLRTKAKSSTSSTMKKAPKLPVLPVDSDTNPWLDLDVSTLLKDEGGHSPLPLSAFTQTALPVASLDRSQHPDTIQRHLTFTQQQILDIATNGVKADEASGPSQKKPPLSSPSKLLPKLDSIPNLDINHHRELPPLTVSSSAHKTCPPPRALQPFPMALGDVSLSHPSSQTLPQQQPSQHHPFSPPPAKKARKSGSSEERHMLHMQGEEALAEMSTISISSGDSDGDEDTFPLLIARSQALERQRLAAISQDVDSDLM